MPAESKAQRKAAVAALAAKRGDIDLDELYGSSRDMYNSMTAEELAEFASTKEKNLPKRKKKNK